MASAGGAAARGAIEAGERGGGQPQADSAGVQGVVGEPCGLSQGDGGGEVGPRRIYQPPYSPELNPAERVFEEVQQWVEGRRYESIEAKKAAAEEVLRRLEAEGKVSSLVGWPYIHQAFHALPSRLRSCVFRNGISSAPYPAPLKASSSIK
jgi:hypothetical protein